MARPTKKTIELEQILINLVHRGYTISDICRKVEIGTSTFNRWRERDPDFNKSIILAGQRQWEFEEETKRQGFRTYKKEWRLSPYYDENKKRVREDYVESQREKRMIAKPPRDYVCSINPNLFIGF